MLNGCVKVLMLGKRVNNNVDFRMQIINLKLHSFACVFNAITLFMFIVLITNCEIRLVLIQYMRNISKRYE